MAAWHAAVQAAGPRLTMTQKEKALEEFAEDGWLAAVPGRPGTYSLGVSAHPAFLMLTLCCIHSLPAGAAWCRIIDHADQAQVPTMHTAFLHQIA